jgi:predicted ATPase
VITRIEIDGFKSFVDFSLDVPPFLVVMGENAGGKSNLVDGLVLLAGSTRSAEMFDAGLGANRGIPAEFFHQYEDGTRVDSLRVAVRSADAQMTAVTASRDADGRMLQATVEKSGGLPVSWVALGVVPAAMRDRGLVSDRRPLQPDGSNLAAVLGRIGQDEYPWQELLADAVALLPELRDIRVAQSRDFWDLELKARGSGWMSVRAASDGTLRVLALLAAAHDRIRCELLIVDEVENGLHPSRLAELIRRLRAISQTWIETGLPRQMILTTHSPVALSALYPEHENEIVFLSAAYGPQQLDDRKVGSVRTIARPVGVEGLPRAVVRGMLDTVRPLGHGG